MKRKEKKLRWLWLVIGAVGILDTLVISAISNMNLGVLLPLIIGAPLFIYGACYKRIRLWMRCGFGYFIRVFFIIGYSLFLAVFILCTTIMLLSSNQPPANDADALVVLGGGVKGDLPTATVVSRLNTALAYLKENKKCWVVVSGGQGPEETATEASVMSKYLQAKGIPPDRILEEDRAASTLENLVFSKRILDETIKPSYRAIYVTNDFHIYRTGLTAQHIGFNAQGLSSPSPWYLFLNNYLRETVAILKTWLLGPDVQI